MKTDKIKARSIIYSLVGILLAGAVWALFFTQIPGLTTPRMQLHEYPGGVPSAQDEWEEDYEKRAEYRYIRSYIDEYLHSLPPVYGLSINGFILGDNPYHVREKELMDYLQRKVFRYGRWTPMSFRVREEQPETPESSEEDEIEEIVKEDVIKEEEARPSGITLETPEGTIHLEYTSGKLPVGSHLYHVTRSYGPSGSEFHYGIDISKDGIDGAEVYSVLPGIISNVGHLEGEYGHYVVVNHGSVSSLYAHLQESPIVNIGDRVFTGDVLGYVGMSGDAEVPHLHFEMDVDGVRFNPEIFIRAAVR